MPQKTQPALELSLARTLRIPRAEVWAAWTKPEIMARWFAPSGMTVTAASADVRVGGQYRIEVAGVDCAGDDGVHALGGSYREVEPGRKLVFTWQRSGPYGPETLVTVELSDAAAGGTELHLTHQGFADADALERHRNGWFTLLDILAADYTKVLAVAAPPERLLAAVTTAQGVAGWWTVETKAEPGGEIRMHFGNSGAALMRVERSDSTGATWLCLECLFPDWVGTRILFDLAPAAGGTELRFRHQGLTPALECYDNCRPGWDRYLGSLQAFAETGQGWPIGNLHVI